jgi:hypothetical protein
MKSKMTLVKLCWFFLIAIIPILCSTTASADRKVAVRGTVQSGGTVTVQPLAGAVVTLFEATSTQPNKLGEATTDSSGNFEIITSRVGTPSIFYATASLGDGVELVAVLGQSLSTQITITINELTTVAASYSMAQFFKTGVISGNSFGLRIAAGMNDNLVSVETGASSPVLLTSPNADQTNSLRSTRALANLLALCVEDHDFAGILFNVATCSGSSPPHNTAQALANIARNPGQNVEAIYDLTKIREIYCPALEAMPDAWTIAVKVNDSGSDAYLIGGLAYVVFDAQGFAWITNDVVQGTTGSSKALVVLKPNGKPADGENGSPVSPITTGGLLGAGFGICIDPLTHVWVGNFGWGGVNPSPTPGTGSGSVSEFNASGQAISPATAYYGGTYRAQGMASDAQGNIWICSFGNDRVVVFLKGDPYNSVYFQEETGSHPFHVVIETDGTAWVSNSGGIISSSLVKFALVGGKLEQQFAIPLGVSLKGIGLDSKGNAWVASGGNSKVYGVRPDGSLIGAFDGGGVDGPWSVTVDAEDNLWVANFGPLQGNFTSTNISELCGANSATWPRGKKTGDPISPPTGFTLPSAGKEVLLHNGEPLYGPGSLPCFVPLMRVTKVAIDQAGNVWAMNNWKPDFAIDALANPGGDGAVIFVGLAPPVKANKLTTPISGNIYLLLLTN